MIHHNVHLVDVDHEVGLDHRASAPAPGLVERGWKPSSIELVEGQQDVVVEVSPIEYAVTLGGN